MIVGPAFTVKFDSKPLPVFAESQIPSGVQWSDLASPGSIVVIQQPEGQRNAVVGGIHMMRLAAKEVKALVVEGRVRDLRELDDIDLPVSKTINYDSPSNLAHLKLTTAGTFTRYVNSRSRSRVQASCDSVSHYRGRQYSSCRRHHLRRPCRRCCPNPN
jgi:hypothetical protein